VYVSSPESIDRLIRVSDYADVVAGRRQKPNQSVLGIIDVLVFVYGYERETLLVFLPNGLMGFKEIRCFKDQVIEIKEMVG